MKSYYLAALSCITALVIAWYAWPFPRFDVSTVPSRAELQGYDRDEFGGWQPNSEAFADCRPQSGTIYDPYAGETISATSPIEVDHIFPLSAAFDMGAAQWDQDTKIRFANDPLNLVATSRKLNQEKSDSLPSEWLPPATGRECAGRGAGIPRREELAGRRTVERAMRRQCRFDF